MMVNMVSWPWDGGSLVIKSIATVWKGRLIVGIMGKSGSHEGCMLILLAWQVPQPLMYSVTKSFMPGHQKWGQMSASVFKIPGWPAVLGE
jgi:hypothetical protein